MLLCSHQIIFTGAKMRTKELIHYGSGDIYTCGPCTGHPNDPRTVQKDIDKDDPEYKAIFNEKLDYIHLHVGGEFSASGTSNGVTDQIAEELGVLLAGISEIDTKKILFGLVWKSNEKDVFDLLNSLFEKACLNVAEEQTFTELGY